MSEENKKREKTRDVNLLKRRNPNLRFPDIELRATAFLFILILIAAFSFMLIQSIKKQYALEISFSPDDRPLRPDETSVCLYVDSLQRHWWSVEHDTIQSPVRLVADTLEVIDIENYVLDDDDLERLFETLVDKYEKLQVLMVIHEKNRHKDFVNIIDAVEVVERKANGLSLSNNNHVVGSYICSRTLVSSFLTLMPVEGKRAISYGFRKWTAEDDRIIRYAVAETKRRNHFIR